ncbi:TIR domain-containing protein [Pseudomonas koreensis]|uniref:TIR domain-containing protein n=1 Tax=Pseudomonas koreensis TaxID=198620 RepID=UPI0021CA9DB6|nr:TIR domain-containing protein [Pseudomonas koreensis]MCU0091937.1 TIR domain-containing protein [Pseudomonas koreensis]
MRRVFISYHHKNEQYLKDELLVINSAAKIFIDCSVAVGDIDEDLEPQVIRQTIRREYLSESTVLILLVGRETQYRKHVDWELYSSMYNGSKFGRSGVVVLLAPDCESRYCTAPSKDIKNSLYSQVTSWVTVNSRDEFERRYEYMPPRIIDCLVKGGGNISVTNWSKVVEDPDYLRVLIESAHETRGKSNYDMSREMRMRNFNPVE